MADKRRVTRSFFLDCDLHDKLQGESLGQAQSSNDLLCMLLRRGLEVAREAEKSVRLVDRSAAPKPGEAVLDISALLPSKEALQARQEDVLRTFYFDPDLDEDLRAEALRRQEHVGHLVGIYARLGLRAVRMAEARRKPKSPVSAKKGPVEQVDPPWKIGRRGRTWRGAEALARHELVSGRIEMIAGRLCWCQEERLRLLALLLENVGVDAALRLAPLKLWGAAVRAAGEIDRRTG